MGLSKKMQALVQFGAFLLDWLLALFAHNQKRKKDLLEAV